MPPALVPALLFALSWLAVSTNARAADGGYFFEAAQAFEQGRYEDVLSALQKGPETDETRYLGARAHAALEQYGQALDRMSEAPESFPKLVREDFGRLRAEWAAEAGRCDDLAKFSTDVEPKPMRALVLRCSFRAGDFQRAADGLKDERDLTSRAMRVEALQKLGQSSEAAKLARALWIEAPAHRDEKRWAELLRQQPSGLTLSDEEHMVRAEAFLSARRPEDAYAELSGLPDKGEKAHRAALWHLRAEALFRTRKRYAEASKAFDKAARLKGKTEAYDAFHAIRALSRAGSDREAIKRYGKFAKAYEKSEYAGDALYLAAWLSAREKLPKAERKLEAVLRSDALDAQPSLKRDLLWDLSWLFLSSHKPQQALRWLVKIVDDKPPLNAQRDYWLAVAKLEAGDKQDGVRGLHEALWADPLGYYAQLAAARLVELGEEPKPFRGEAPALERPKLELPEDVRFYQRLGLLSDAARASERWAKGVKDKLSVVAAHSEVGHAEKSHASAEPLLSSLMQGPSLESNRWLWRAAFPEPYLAIVERETQTRELPRSLFYGHMQVESRYKAGAVSGADAIGLMQLLPGTAQSVAKGLDLEVDRTSLKEPATNITLGAAYLGSLLKRYHGQFPLAIAAYNAGTQRVDGWLTRGCPCDTDRWVEDIPVEQTRNYVRRVISAWGRYHYLDHPDSPWDLGLPSKLSAAKD